MAPAPPYLPLAESVVVRDGWGRLDDGPHPVQEGTAPERIVGEGSPPLTEILPPSQENVLPPSPENVPTASWFDSVVHPKPERDSALRRLWSHPWAKVGALCLAAVVAVVLIVGGIRLAHNNNSGSNALSTSTTSPRHTSAHVAPISPAALTKYEGYAEGLKKANDTATSEFLAGGSTPTLAKIGPAVAAYRTAVNLYDFQLHFIQWPASMETALADDHAQMHALLSVLDAFPQVSATGVGAWLSQLHDRTSTAQAADNQLRQDLGLPSTSSFP